VLFGSARTVAASLGKGFTVRRIAFAKGGIHPIEHPNGKLLRDREEELRDAVRSTAGSAPRRRRSGR
jgi:hypothetical protein